MTIEGLLATVRDMKAYHQDVLRREPDTIVVNADRFDEVMASLRAMCTIPVEVSGEYPFDFHQGAPKYNGLAIYKGDPAVMGDLMTIMGRREEMGAYILVDPPEEEEDDA